MDMMTDMYPSRVTSEPSVTPRRDSVIHAGPIEQRDGPLSEEQLAIFERRGALTIREFFKPEEIACLREHQKELFREASESDRPEVIREHDNDAVRSIFAVHRDDPVIRDLSRDSRLVAMAEQILGRGVYIHQSRINYKPGFSGNAFQWHSDFETWHTEDGMPHMHAFSVSIALEDNLYENGPLMTVPGSHKYFVSCVGETPEVNYKTSLRRQEIGIPDEENLTWLVERGNGLVSSVGPAGSITIFDCNTLHASNKNITPYPRSNVFFVYNSVENKPVRPFCNRAPRPEFLATREGDTAPLKPL